MKVILTEDVVGLGDIGETVKVRPGYARNFLIPRGFALEAGVASAREVAHHMRQIEAKKRRMKSSAEDIAKRIRELTADFELRVGSGGQVFGSVGAKDVAEKLKTLGHELDRKRVLLPEPLKKIGTHFVRIKLHPEVEALLKVVIEQREATKEQEQAETKRAKEQLEAAATEREEAAPQE